MYVWDKYIYFILFNLIIASDQVKLVSRFDETLSTLDYSKKSLKSWLAHFEEILTRSLLIVGSDVSRLFIIVAPRP